MGCGLDRHALRRNRHDSRGNSLYNPPISPPADLVRSLALTLKVVLFLLLLGFAVMNSEPVRLRYFLGLEWQAPLSMVILVVFAAGLVTGLLACSMRLLRGRRELHKLRKELNRE